MYKMTMTGEYSESLSREGIMEKSIYVESPEESVKGLLEALEKDGIRSTGGNSRDIDEKVYCFPNGLSLKIEKCKDNANLNELYKVALRCS